MNYSLPKGRNSSKENLPQKKLYGIRHSQKNAFFSLLNSNNVLVERGNKSLNRRQSEDTTLKRNSQSTNQIIKFPSNYDTKYSNLNKRIKDILDSDQKMARSQVPIQKNITIQPLTRSSLLRRNQVLSRQEIQLTPIQKKESLANGNLYFLECLKRKNSVTTQFYINIHTSILTFKQFYKLAQQCKPRPTDPSIPTQTPNRKTIVFDMDQTLIHTSEVMTPGYEIKVPFKAFQGKVSNGYVNVRPYAKELLKRLSKHFDVVVFTAGNKCYADPILDHIDPNGVIQHRLYRESCTFVANQLFVKDLRILGRKLENVVLVDNAPHSYMMQFANGIPILNYFKGKQDNQLYYLEKYLMNLIDVADVRLTNTQYFRLHQYMKYDSHDKLITALYAKKL